MQRKITIILDHLRSAYNTGNIFRIAEAVHAEIIGCGYTPLPPHPKLARTAIGTDAMVPFRHCETAQDAVKLLQSEGFTVLAVDNIESAVNVWNREYDYPLGLLFGNEALGIDPAALTLCDGAVKLPMFGEKSSINVGNSCAAVVYAILGKEHHENPVNR